MWTEPIGAKLLGNSRSMLVPLGIVFGEIGTSPLYTLKDVFDITGSHPEQRGFELRTPL
jgi:K+ transporter